MYRVGFVRKKGGRRCKFLLNLILTAFGLKDPFILNENESWMPGAKYLFKNQKCLAKIS
jgi:hypothetical protein